jgi:hypothetical protein
MNRNVIFGIIIAVIVVGGGIYYYSMNGYKSPSTSSSTTSSTSPSASPAAPPATGTAFTINANDESADITTLNVKKGDKITVTFNVKEDGTYHGGLQFDSDVVNSKPILPGKSDTVTFTADKSFDFTPYWYQSSVKKDYVVSVHVS